MWFWLCLLLPILLFEKKNKNSNLMMKQRLLAISGVTFDGFSLQHFAFNSDK